MASPLPPPRLAVEDHQSADKEAEAEAEAMQPDETEGDDNRDEAHAEAVERLEQLCRHLLTQYEEVAAQVQAACQERDDAVASEAMAEEMCEQATAEAARLGAELSRLHRDSMDGGAAREAVVQEAAEATEAERGLRLAAEEREAALKKQLESLSAELEAEAAEQEKMADEYFMEGHFDYAMGCRHQLPDFFLLNMFF